MPKKMICLAVVVLLAVPVLAEDFKSSGPQAIGQVANAIADEVINLHLYLDNIETKENLRKAWDEKFSASNFSSMHKRP